MNFYSELSRIVAQVPSGRVAFLADVARALGDRGASVSLPGALAKIAPTCKAAARVIRADGGPVTSEASSVLAREGVAVRGSKVVHPEGLAFRDFRTNHPLEKLRASQVAMAKRVVLRDAVKLPRVMAGVDASYDGDRCFAAAVAVEAESLAVAAQVVVETDVDFPYVPGYLAYRESPPLLRAIRELPITPDVILVDGHGILHPAKFGIASHVGVTAGIPTIGIGKSHLVGEIDDERIGEGDAAAVRIDGRILGHALWSSRSAKPIYVSPGNLVSPKTALEIARMACKGRIPEPIRHADAIAREKRREKSRL